LPKGLSLLAIFNNKVSQKNKNLIKCIILDKKHILIKNVTYVKDKNKGGK
jgi:hypothetical protein